MTASPVVSVPHWKAGLPGFSALGRLVVGFLLLCAVADLAAVVFDLSYHHAVVRLENGDILSIGSALTAEDRHRAIGWTQLALFLVTGAFFIAWFHRVYKNVGLLGAAGRRFRTGWAIGARFVPFLNLVRPKAIANDIWPTFERAVNGVGGWVDDDLALLQPWGFDVADISVPVLVRYGMTDVFVPPAHGEWLAANVPGCIVKVSDVAGHLGSSPEEEIAENARWLSAGIAPDGSRAPVPAAN